MNVFFYILIRTSAYLFIFTLVFSCAQIVNPNGGPKDIKPPLAVKYIPDSAKTNFSAKNIAIVFDEYIQLNDLQKQLVISPPMNIQPEVKVKGKLLLIELKDTLKKNTTYTFNFGNSIRDFTEANAIEDFQYVFSTGNFIDSLKLKGVVKNAFDLKTEKGILVMLYDTHNDSVPCKKLPSYFSRTKEDGSYKINNIKSGIYKVFALKDANANYIYDLPTESIAFSDTLITINKNSSLDLSLFKEEPQKQKLLKANFSEHGHILFAFAKPTNDSLKLNFLSQEPKENVIYEYSKNKDTLHYWFTDDFKDTMKIQIAQGSKILDTARLKPVTIEQMKKNVRGEKWGLKVTAKMNENIYLNKTIDMYFSHPVKNIKSDSKISFKSDSVDLSEVFSHIHFTDDQLKRKATIDFSKVKESTSYHLLIPPATFTDIFGLTNDTIKLDFKTEEEKYYGTLKLTLKMKIWIKYILQLMNEKGEVFDYASSDKGVFSYIYLSPGSYKLRIIYDYNGDDKWTTGNYFEKKKPETVIYYSSPITIRSNWDLELEWKVE